MAKGKDLLDYNKIKKTVNKKGIITIPDQVDWIKKKLVSKGYDVAGPYLDEEDEEYIQYPYLEITKA